MLRPVLAVLNELSTPTDAGDVAGTSVDEVIEEFVTLLRALRSIRSDMALVSREHLSAVEIDGDGTTLAGYLNAKGGRARELWRYLQSMRNHAPFARAPQLRLMDGAEEYRLAGERADGLGLAASNHQIGVSMNPGAWPQLEIQLEHAFLVEVDGSDELQEASRSVSVRHASTPDHVASLAADIRQLALPMPFSGRDLWLDREALYPSLRFLPRVEGQLSKSTLGRSSLDQIAGGLERLQAAVAEWDPSKSRFPTWGFHVTPEHENRKGKCWFTDLDGVKRCFDLHARYTPGAGRIHFRLDPSEGIPRLTVAHIGQKIP